MKKCFSAVLASLALFAPAAFGAFRASQTATQLQDEVAAQFAAGKSLAEVASAALAVGVDAGAVTRAMLATGANRAGVPADTVKTASAGPAAGSTSGSGSSGSGSGGGGKASGS